MASRGLEGFSPAIRRLLEQAGIDLSGGGSAAAAPVWGRGLAPSAAEQAASPWYQLQRQSGVTPDGWLDDQANPALMAARSDDKLGKALDPSVRKLLDQITRAREQEAQRGAADQRTKPNWLLRGLDYIGRPGAAVMGALTEQERTAKQNDQADGSDSMWDTIRTSVLGTGLTRKAPANIARGASRGFTGEERYHGSKLLDEAGVDNRFGRAVAGFGLDVATDPLTYLTAGVGSVGAKGAEATARAVAVREGATAASSAGARMPVDELVRNLTRPRRQAPLAEQAVEQAATDVGRAAATNARTSLADALVKVGMPAATAKASAVRWMNPAARLAPAAAAERTAWLAKVAADPATAGVRTGSAAAIAQEAAAATRSQLTALAEESMQAAARKAVTFKYAGVPLGSVPVPAAVSAAASRAAAVPAAAKALEAFDKVFTTGSRFDRKLTALKARSAGLAERRIEAMRDELVTTFKGTTKAQRTSLMEAITSAPGWGAGVVKLADGRDAAEAVRDVFDHVGRYVDWSGKGSGLLTVADLNRFLPKAYKFDKTAIEAGDDPAENVLKLVSRNAGHLRTADPAQLLYAVHIATEKAIARDQLARGAASFGVPLARLGQDLLGKDGRMVGATATAAKELRDKHGWSEIVTTGRDKDVGASYARHFDGLIFDPETKRGLTRLLAVADDVSARGELLRLYDGALGGLKKALTLPSPSYHLRNSFGDLFLGYLDDVSGPRGARSYQQASRTMTALRTLGQRPALREVLDGAVDPVTGVADNPLDALAAAVKAGGREPGPGARVMRTPKAWPDAPGEYLSAEQVWAAYNHAGLKRGFVAADLTDELKVGRRRPVGAVSDKLMDFSQAREDYFRLAHFIDRLKRSKADTFEDASTEAAHFVRKYHFDYHDVTPTEQAVLARIFPFYKFQRFAAPLMVQMFFARPGKILNAQRGLYGVSDASGYERDDLGLPGADQVLPEYFRDAAMVPLFDSARGNTVYMNPGFPSTAIPAQTLGLSGGSPGEVAAGIGQNLVGSVNPIVQAPFELATGRRVFGGGDIPVGPLPQYLAGKTPITNQAFVRSGKEDADTSWASFVTGLGLSENTPARQRGALMDELDRIYAQRKKDGFTAPKSGRPGRSDSRPGR